MNRPAIWVVIATAVVAVLLAAAASSGEVQLAERAPSIPWEFGSSAGRDRFELPSQSALAEGEREAVTPLTWPRFITVIGQAIGLGALVVLAFAFSVYLWRHRPRLTVQPQEPEDFDVLDALASSVVADAGAQLALLRSGRPGNAIVSCWLRLETLVADAEVEHSPADTPTELAARVLSGFAVDETAITTLSDLYREARFSDHDMGEPARARAIAALDAVHEGLRRRRTDSGVGS